MLPSTLTRLSYLPAILQRRLTNRPNLQKILINISWLFADRILSMSIGLLVGVWVARYLGPEQFGLFNYTSAFVALFGAIATLGLNGIVVRDLVKEPKTTNATLGTAFVMQLIGGLLACGMAVIIIGYVRPGDVQTKLMVAILGFVMVFKSTEVVKYWFESQVQSKYTVLVENAVFIVIAGIKILLIIGHAPLMTFVCLVLVEAALVAIGLLVVYVRRGNVLRNWQVQIQRAKPLLKDSWPLMLSGLAILVYMRIDQIMLGQMLGDEAVGIYSAAVRISEVWYFVPMAIVSSVFPSIIEAKKNSVTLYYQRMQWLYDVMVVLALSVAVPMTFLSNWIVSLLFGKAYEQAGAVLAIHIWTSIFVGLNFSSGRWFINEGYTLLALKRNLLGLVVNVTLNIYMIPLYGPKGAALATLLSYSMASYASDLFSRKTRGIFLQKTRALFFVSIITAIAKHKK